jgi:hypothetical protein
MRSGRAKKIRILRLWRKSGGARRSSFGHCSLALKIAWVCGFHCHGKHVLDCHLGAVP